MGLYAGLLHVFLFVLYFIYLLRPKNERVDKKRLNWLVNMQFLPFALDIQADHNRTKHIYIDMGLKEVHCIKAEGLLPCSLCQVLHTWPMGGNSMTAVVHLSFVSLIFLSR